MKISIDKISHSAPIIWNIMEVVSWLCVISRLQKLLFSYLKTTLWRVADSCRDALVDNSCSLDGNSIPTNVTSSWLLSLRHSAPPRALRVELMSLISEVCSVVREAKNSPGSSSFCAAERLTFRCRPPLTWMEVKKHLTAQLCETFARNGSNSESFCTGAASRSNPDLLWFSGDVSKPFCAGYQRLLLQFQTEHNQQPTRWNAPAEGCESGFLWFAF